MLPSYSTRRHDLKTTRHLFHTSTNSPTHIVILGAGIAGLSTAHYLLAKTSTTAAKSLLPLGSKKIVANDDFEIKLSRTKITIVDKCSSIASGGPSRLNGGLLCPSLSQSWTSNPLLFGEDAIVSSLLWRRWRNIGDDDNDGVSPVMFDWRKLMFDRRFLTFGGHWALQRLANRKNIRTDNNSDDNNNPLSILMNYSMSCFDDTNDNILSQIDYGRFAQGTQQPDDGTIDERDSSGDIKQFCDGLTSLLVTKYGPDRFTLELGKMATGFEMDDGGRVVAVTLSSSSDEASGGGKGDGEDNNDTSPSLTADHFVIALGNGSSTLVNSPSLSSTSIPCPLYPVKGYLVTFTSSIPLIYNRPLSSRSFVAPMGPHTYRLSGMADFVGSSENDDYNDKEVSRQRRNDLIAAGRQAFPDMIVLDDDETPTMGWSCRRPVSPDDLPLIGQTKIDNVWMCTGHGSKGWTMGPGSGKLLADLIYEGKGEIDHVPYDPRRFEARYYWNSFFGGGK